MGEDGWVVEATPFGGWGTIFVPGTQARVPPILPALNTFFKNLLMFMVLGNVSNI